MPTQEFDQSVANCEQAILEFRDKSITQNYIPEAVVIAGRFIERRFELVDFYKELDTKLKSNSTALYQFFDSVFLTASYWNLEENKKARAERNELKTINEQIAIAARKLSGLMEQRTNLNDTSGFYSDTHYGVCETLDAAGGSNFSYESWVQDDFKQLYCRFGLTYWPTFTEFFEELAQDAEQAEIRASNEVTAAATTGARSSLKDYLRALQKHLDDNFLAFPHLVTAHFRLSDSAIASLVNCVLDLDPDEMKDAAYVKRFRQGERERAEKEIELEQEAY
ncbi:hypothetical protein [Cohaesibacter gelatinilyticus]|uniref:Uncharacterized protein n=1 Tax=Cohaesibacter gelatinilyticus TaxID=372072 RepID=A0A285PDT9_9HYPH|nr:hypothetical protein [Cohaesibacter gelatinilyticus]SNZ19618.1 hypothetical protein SAMN06265368_2708 [Cohaesibacter gelatinilyticus]